VKWQPRIVYNPQAVSQSFAGTGNGTMTGLAAVGSPPYETWSIVATSATNFTVTGSVSGAQAAATVGTPYNNGKIAFTLNAGGVAFTAGATFTVVVGTTLDLTFGMRPYAPHSKVTGGYGVAASGATASYTQRRDQMMSAMLRFYASEWAAIAAWFEWAQDNAGVPFNFWLDQTNSATNFPCYLDAPHTTQDVKPSRSTEWHDMFEQEITLRSSVGTRFPANWLT
jgi:hypothetical protein